MPPHATETPYKTQKYRNFFFLIIPSRAGLRPKNWFTLWTASSGLIGVHSTIVTRISLTKLTLHLPNDAATGMNFVIKDKLISSWPNPINDSTKNKFLDNWFHNIPSTTTGDVIGYTYSQTTLASIKIPIWVNEENTIHLNFSTIHCDKILP